MTETGPKTLSLEEKTDLEIKNVLNAYPFINDFPDNFKYKLDILITKIQSIKEGSFQKETARNITYDDRKNKIFLKKDGGEMVETSMGEIVSGVEWGREFNLDYSKFKTKKLGQDAYEKYVLAFARNSILNLLDNYILENEIKKSKESGKQEAYTKTKENKDVKPENILQMGLIAEKMVQSLLVRLAIKYPQLGFELIHVNAYQDVELKIDFIIKLKNKNKGIEVDLEKDDIIKNIQFTINGSVESDVTKARQLAKVENVILVKMPELEISEAFNAWKEKQNTSIGGPDIFLRKKTEDMILAKILE